MVTSLTLETGVSLANRPYWRFETVPGAPRPLRALCVVPMGMEVTGVERNTFR